MTHKTNLPEPLDDISPASHTLIPESERHGRARDLFAVWAAPNVNFLSFIVGTVLVLTGLTLGQALAVAVAGSLFAAFTGVVAASGPAAGTPSEVITRTMYGVRGNRVNVAVAGWLAWQGYLLGSLGLGGREGSWAYANLGVLAALVIGFVGTLLLGARSVRAQEEKPLSEADLEEAAVE